MAARGASLCRMRGKEQNLPLALQAGPGASEPGHGCRNSQPLALQQETVNLLSPPSPEGDVASLSPRGHRGHQGPTLSSGGCSPLLATTGAKHPPTAGVGNTKSSVTFAAAWSLTPTLTTTGWGDEQQRLQIRCGTPLCFLNTLFLSKAKRGSACSRRVLPTHGL